jgi:G3E family GTPase
MASELAERLRLDAIVTLVDARHIDKELDEAPEPAQQIAFADVLLLNKTDLVSPAEADRIEARLRKMNSLAAIHRTTNAQIDPARLLNVRARDLSAGMALPASASQPSELEHEHDGHDHSHCDHDHGHCEHEPAGEHEDSGHTHAHHDESVSSFYISDDRPLDLQKVEAWLSEVIREMGEKIYRSKGILQIRGQPKRVIFQGVQMMFDARPDRLWNVGERRMSQLVFIGKQLDEARIRRGFAACLADS